MTRSNSKTPFWLMGEKVSRCNWPLRRLLTDNGSVWGGVLMGSALRSICLGWAGWVKSVGLERTSAILQLVFVWSNTKRIAVQDRVMSVEYGLCGIVRYYYYCCCFSRWRVRRLSRVIVVHLQDPVACLSGVDGGQCMCTCIECRLQATLPCLKITLIVWCEMSWGSCSDVGGAAPHFNPLQR